MTPGAGSGWETIIGLEVHAQLKTRTKLFCGCANRFGAPPNSLTCPVCTGQPGALPVLNEAALHLALRAAVALGCTVAPRSKFDRKNYFYCDLPKGYQISQYDEPYCSGGGIDLAPEHDRFVRLTRIHLEEDAGKAIHDRGDRTLVDLNRAGVPLIESVTEADLRSSAEAVAYLVALKEILQFAGVSDCDMEKGSLRCDVNVSVHRPDTPWGTKVELKNLNSFRHVRDAIEHETTRQVSVLESGGTILQETRLWDPTRATTRTMRTKEDEQDYRYFPDPDLPPLCVEEALLEATRAALPELPAARRARYVTAGLTPYDAGVVTSSPALSAYFEELTTALAEGSVADAKTAANWVANDLQALATREENQDRELADLLAPRALAELVALVETGTLARNAARDVLAAVAGSGESPAAYVEREGLAQVSDEGELETWVAAALEANAGAVEDVRAGRMKALGAIVGAVMKASRGKANPKRVSELVRARILGDG